MVGARSTDEVLPHPDGSILSGGTVAENVETGDEIKLCSRSLPQTTDEQQLQNAAFCLV